MCIATLFPDDTYAAGPLLHINFCHSANHTALSLLMSLTTLPVISIIGYIYCLVTFHTPTACPQTHIYY